MCNNIHIVRALCSLLSKHNSQLHFLAIIFSQLIIWSDTAACTTESWRPECFCWQHPECRERLWGGGQMSNLAGPSSVRCLHSTRTDQWMNFISLGFFEEIKFARECFSLGCQQGYTHLQHPCVIPKISIFCSYLHEKSFTNFKHPFPSWLSFHFRS